ncbi:MAG: T9SS type A sorting domain-containing protein [Cytophagaceae bacterium]
MNGHTTGKRKIVRLILNLHIRELFKNTSSNLQFNPGTSNIYSEEELTIESETALEFYNIHFSNTSGKSTLKNASSGISTFHEVIFEGNGELYGDNTFESLHLSTGKTYTFEGGKMQQISTELSIESSCSDLTTITSTSSVQAIINLQGEQSFSSLRLSGIEVQGNTPYTAFYSEDLGNNSGWNITGYTDRTLYWVNNSGDWEDPSHWAIESGGTAGHCPPRETEDVVFDESSFSEEGVVVSLSGDNLLCRNMSWQGTLFNPEFSASETSILHIHGSLSLIPQMKTSLNGEIHFIAEEQDNSLFTAGKAFGGSVFFEADNDHRWTFLDHFNGPNTIIHLVKGILNPDGNNITSKSFIATSQHQSTLSLTSETITVGKWEVNTEDFHLSPGLSTILISGTSGTGMYNKEAGTINYYNVEFRNASHPQELSSANASVSFNKVLLAADVKIMGNHYYDTLLFTPGNTYTLQAHKTQNIGSYIKLRGNPCKPITLKSTSEGARTWLHKIAGDVVCDYLILKDIAINGSARFFAGENSTNQGNNFQWYFTDAPGYSYGLPSEYILENGETIRLGIENIESPVSFFWNDESLSPYKDVSSPGIYWLQVNYGNDCPTALRSKRYIVYVYDENMSLSVTEAENHALRIYPVPSPDIVNISYNNRSKQEIYLELYNSKGEKIADMHFPEGISFIEERLNLSGQSPGMYLLKMTQGEIISTYKIIKE